MLALSFNLKAWLSELAPADTRRLHLEHERRNAARSAKSAVRAVQVEHIRLTLV